MKHGAGVARTSAWFDSAHQPFSNHRRHRIDFSVPNLKLELLNRKFQAQRCNFQHQRCNFQAQRCNIHPQKLNVHPQKLNVHPQRLNVHSQRLNVHPQRLNCGNINFATISTSKNPIYAWTLKIAIYGIEMYRIL